jgi:serine phosphatase RsbU (regulator of sigma subunit)
MKKFVIILLMSFLASTSFSANEIIVKGNVHFSKDNVKILFDYDKKISINEIDRYKFIESPNRNLNYGFFNGRIWVKFKLDSLKEAVQFLEVKNPLIDILYLYQREGGNWVLKDSIGDIYEFSTRSVVHRFPQFKITSSGEYLLRAECKGDLLALKMNLFSASQIEKRDYGLQLFAGMYFGILCIVLLFNLFMYIMLRGKNNLILIFFLLFMCIFELGLTGFGYEWLWGKYPYIQGHILPWSAALSILFLIWFVVVYLKIKVFAPKTYYVLIISSGVVVSNFFLSLLDIGSVNIYVNSSNNIITLFLVLSVIPVVISAVKNRFKSSRLVLISFIGLSAGVLISHLHYFGQLDIYFFDNVNIQFGVLFQAVFLTFAVLDGYKIFKDKSNNNLREISRLKEKQIIKLEEEVNLRTNELTKQKEQLEHVNNDIISSINYAHRIQNALIPEERNFLKNFREGFLHFRSKEIVSGDFYWTCVVKDKNEKGEIVEKNVICVGDTNTQGVPGSILSVLALRLIQASVYKESVTSPGKLLDVVNEELLRLFPKLEKKEEKVKGVYCSICVVDKTSNAIEFAGSMGRIFVRKDNLIEEIKGDNQLLGKGPINYSTQTVQLNRNDILYLGTDGYKNQLKKNPDLKGKDLIDILNAYAHLPIKEQESVYLKMYEDMVNRDGQVDDFCIIGIVM